jgi:SAM-dependent methyltransferase
MNFGLRHPFTYRRCEHCRSLYIAEVPADLGPYYGDAYYSQHEIVEEGSVRRAVKRARARGLFGRRSIAGAALRTLFGAPRGGEQVLSWLRSAGVERSSSVLDVGCGTGRLLVQLHNLGLTRLEGIDPYTEGDLHYRSGVRVYRRELGEHTGSYDFVMMHHALEHTTAPAGELAHIRRLLKPGGVALVRVPLAASFAADEYGSFWVQLDAPRHLLVPSEQGMRIASDRAGLEVESIDYDSTAFQFWGSEQYRLGIPLLDARSFARDPQRSPFTPVQIERWEALASQLNRDGTGDQAAFYLRKA